MSHKRNPIIFANPVRDLTMARYLAAMEVDYFGIDLDEPDSNKIVLLIHQIKEWVQGPKLIGVSSTPAVNIASLYPLDGYYFDVEMDFPKESIIFQSHLYFLNNQNSNPSFIIIDNLHDVIKTQQCIIKTSIYNDPIENEDIKGFMISPGKEEKIGIYDFEKLDEWFEKLKIKK